MIEVKNIKKKFGKKIAVNNLSYVFENGVYGLLGTNGAGKTTLIRCMLGLYPCKGQVIWENKEKKERKVGYLPQKNGTFPGLTVEEHLQYFACMKEMKKDEMQEEIDRVLEMVNLTEQKNKRGKELSGGMVRRLGIAQALLNHPEMIVFDEPTTGLDPEERMRFKNMIQKIGRHCTVLMSTHIVEDVESVCDKILIMKDGQFIADGNQSEICNYAQGKVYEIPKNQLKEEDYVEKEFLLDELEYVRILSNRMMDMEPVTATVEDGYLTILKGI